MNQFESLQISPSIKRRSRKVTAMISLFAIGLLAGSCKPYDYSSGGITIQFENTDLIMVNAPAMSCRSAKSTTPTDDLAPLSMDLGKIAMTWSVPNTTTVSNPTKLKLVYVAIRFRSNGLTNTDTPLMITGQDLNCVVSGNPDGSSILAESQGGLSSTNTTAYQFQYELRMGALTPADASKKKSFSGTASVVVYGLIQQTGYQDRPVIGRGTFKFSFGGIVF